ncbi:glycosyltransferase [Rhodoflexus sp.]
MELSVFWLYAIIVISSIVLLHLLLQGVWFVRLAFFKPKSFIPTKYEDISVIVAARNEHDNLTHLLPMLLEQEYPADYEIIVADDNSTDDTFWLLKTACQAFDRLKVVTVSYTPPGIHPKKYALTLAIKAARFERLVFIDADCRPASNGWLAALAAQFDDKQIVLGYSPYRTNNSLLGRLIGYETLYTAMQYISSALWGYPYMGVGRNLAYTKTLFLDHKGFSKFQRVIGGDDDLFVNSVANKSNTTVAIGADTLTYSMPKTKWSEWWKQKRRHLSVGRYYHWKDRLWLGLNSILTMSVQLITIGALAVALVMQQWIVAAIMAGIILVRWSFLGTITYLCARQLGERFNIIWFPLLDFFHTVYYFTVGLSVMISEKVEWR